MAESQLPSWDDLDSVFQEYAKAVGTVAHNWNKLQEELAGLFELVTGMPSDVARKVWYAVQNDRTQRTMLRAAMSGRSKEYWDHQSPRAKKAINWLLEQADSLATDRNVAIHGPCSMGIDQRTIVMMPTWFFGNPHAVSLRGKKVLEEFNRYAETARALHEYCEKVRTALMHHPRYPWPDKPQLPRPKPA